jgi:hypothetical protein
LQQHTHCPGVCCQLGEPFVAPLLSPLVGRGGVAFLGSTLTVRLVVRKFASESLSNSTETEKQASPVLTASFRFISTSKDAKIR